MTERSYRCQLSVRRSQTAWAIPSKKLWPTFGKWHNETMDLLFELNVAAAPKGSREVSSTLYRQLKSAILDGRLRPGTRLPSTRSASVAFGVSRNTAQDVYERLTHEGLVNARHGSGTYVSRSFLRGTIDSASNDDEAQDARVRDFWISSEMAEWISFWREREEPKSEIVVADLRPALIDPKLFPHATFRQVMARQLRRLETRSGPYRSPQGNQGNYQLRKAISEHIGLTRAVSCAADDVLVTSGAQQAFDLIARILVKPDATLVAVEDPGYPPMRVPFAAAGAKLAPVRVDSEGIVVDEIPEDANIICVCPSHQFPLGMSMSPARRAALLRFAKRTGAVIIEDDYDGEFRYDGSPLEALRNNASSDQVFFVGSFSKCMFHSIRLGFVVPPRWAIRPLIMAKNGMDWHCATPMQAAVGSFILDGHLARHVRRVRRTYRERRAHLVELLESRLEGLFRVIPSYYGTHIAALATRDLDCEAISAALGRRGIMMHSVDRYFLGPVTSPGFIISYAAADLKAIEFAISALAEEAAQRLAQASIAKRIA